MAKVVRFYQVGGPEVIEQGSGGAVTLSRCDITDEAAVRNWSGEVEAKRESKLDFLISNAGILTPGPLELGMNPTSRDSACRLNDETLVEAAEGGHSTAFETPSELYRTQLLAVAHRITRSREDAEDAVQDALLRAFVDIGDFEGRSNLRTWLTRITINSALMILRKKRATPELAIGGRNDFGVEALRYEPTDHAPNPEKRYRTVVGRYSIQLDGPYEKDTITTFIPD